MEPDAAITVTMVQVAVSVGGLVIVGAAMAWAAYRFVKSEREKGEEKVMTALKAVEASGRAEDEKLHGRISSVARETVRRDDYHEDQKRTQEILKAIQADVRAGQEDVRTGMRTLTERMDRFYTPRVGGD